MKPFPIERPQRGQARQVGREGQVGVPGALRRWRPSVPARVRVGPDRQPVRVSTDRPGITGGIVVSCAGPWRTSGAWWEETAGRVGLEGQDGRVGQEGGRPQGGSGSWDRDEWDVALNDGTVYRIFQDRSTHAWFLDALID